MRILYVLAENLNRTGGGIVHFLAVARGLKRLGHQVVILGPQYGPTVRRPRDLRAIFLPVLMRSPATFLGFQWHSDTFDLPAGAVPLLRSSAYENQGFRFGDAAYGIQFHLEVDDRLAAEWAEVPAYRRAADATLGPGGLERLLDDFRTHAAAMQLTGRTVFARWCELAERRAGVGAGSIGAAPSS